MTQRTADICITWLAYLACLHSHVLLAYGNFESKQVNSITLFGQRLNNKLIFPTLTIPFSFRWSQCPKCHCILDLKLPNGCMQEYFPLFLPFFTFPPWSSPFNHFLDSLNPLSISSTKMVAEQKKDCTSLVQPNMPALQAPSRLCCLKKYSHVRIRQSNFIIPAKLSLMPFL